MSINQKKAGVILSYASEAIKILTLLIYTPVMLRILGQSEYGLYQLVYSLVSYLSLLSLGFGSSYMRFYARFKAENDMDGVARLNGMFMTIFMIIALICTVCGVVMIVNIRSIFADGLTDAEYDTAKVLMGFMVFNLAISFPRSVFDCNVTAHERFLFQKALLCLQNLFNPFLTLPLLLLGYGSVGMVLVTTVLSVVTLVINAYYCFRKLKIRFLFRGFQLSLLGEMWVFTFFIFLNQIIDQINWSVDKFLLGRIAGTISVAIYGIGAQINLMYQQFSVSISNVFVPKVNRIVAESSDNRMLTMLMTRVGRIQFMVLSLFLTGFIFFGQPFIRFWGGEEYEQSYFVALFLIAPVTVPLIQNLGIEIQRAKNMHKARSVVYFFIAVGNVLVSIPLIYGFGAVGASIGTAVSLVLGNIIFMNWYYHFRIGLDMRYYWKEIFKFFPALLAPCAAGTLMMIFIPINSVWSMVMWATVYTALFAVSMWLFGMNPQEKEMISAPARKVWSRLRRRGNDK